MDIALSSSARGFWRKNPFFAANRRVKDFDPCLVLFQQPRHLRNIDGGKAEQWRGAISSGEAAFERGREYRLARPPGGSNGNQNSDDAPEVGASSIPVPAGRWVLTQELCEIEPHYGLMTPLRHL
jgi:hypothetical protein